MSVTRITLQTVTLKALSGILVCFTAIGVVRAKEWRGVVPLKSTRDDVERILGKPQGASSYKSPDGMVYILYSDAPCTNRDNCWCLVPPGTVLRIFLNLESGLRLSKLKADLTKFQRYHFQSDPPMSTYSDMDAGIVYTLDEARNLVTEVTYLPAKKDCDALLRKQNSKTDTNAWRGLVPLRSARPDVERVLGKPKTSHGATFVYETTDEAVDVLYSAGPCALNAVERWNVAADVVIRIDVRPHAKVLIDSLRLDKVRYPRLPEAHPEDWARYMNDEDGVMVETIMYGKDEEVYMITYWPRSEDKGLRCPKEGVSSAEG